MVSSRTIITPLLITVSVNVRRAALAAYKCLLTANF